MPKINHEEYELLKSLGDQWKWIARNSVGSCEGNLLAHSEKPIKLYGDWEWAYGGWFRPVDNHPFQFIKWEDREPYSIDNLIEEYEIENGMRYDFGKIKVVGNEVGEEQKFYVMSNDNRMMLVRMMNDETITEADPIPFDELYDAEKKSYRLTEQEIKDYDSRYWPFRKPVEEVEENDEN